MYEDSELHIALGNLYGCVGRAAQALRSRAAPLTPNARGEAPPKAVASSALLGGNVEK